MKAYGGMSIPLDPVADDLGWPSVTRLAPEVTTALQIFSATRGLWSIAGASLLN